MCALILLASAFLHTAAWAQTNSWIASAGDKWETATNWSLGLAPTNTQSIFVTNSDSKIVTIDSTTAVGFSDTMSASDLSISTPDGSTNTLFISGTGTNLPLTILNSLSLSSGGMVVISNSAVYVQGLDGGFLNLGGGVLVEDGYLVVLNGIACGQDPGLPGALTVSGISSISGALYVGVNTNATGSVQITGGQVALTNGPIAIGSYGTGQMVVSNDAVLTSDQPVLVGLGAGSQGAVTVDGAAWIAADDLVAGQVSGSTGVVQINNGQLTVTNGFFTLIGGAGLGQHVWSNSAISVGPMEVGADAGSPCTLIVAGGVASVQGAFDIGVGAGATGLVWMTDGQLVATNAPVYVGSYGVGSVTVSNGVWLGRDMVIGSKTNSLGQVTQEGGTVSLSSKLILGKWSDATGEIHMNNGSLNVTNATGTALLLVGGPTYVTFPPTNNCYMNCPPTPTLSGKGVVTQNGGTVTVDQLLLTNGPNSVYSFSAGTLQTKATSVIYLVNYGTYTPPYYNWVITSTVTNPQTFVVGDGIQPATFHLLGGVHSFVNDLRIRTSSFLTGCGTINGNVLVEGTVVADCGGTLTFSGVVTNNGVIKATGGSVIEGYGTVVNNGVIDVINGNTNFHSAFINNGLVLDAASDTDGDGMSNLQESLAGTDPTNSASVLRITSVAREGNNVRVTWSAVGGHSYVLQSTRSAAIACYTTNFADASPVIVVSDVGETTTNYVDVGAAYVPVVTPPGGTMASTGTPSTVAISAADTRGIADSLGGAVPVGSLLMLGTFSIDEPAIQSTFYTGNVSAIMSNFTPYSTSFAVGDGTGLPATWSVLRSAAGFGGKQIYLLVVDTPALAKATHLGIFTASSWVFPDDGDEIDVALEDVTDFVIGAHGGPLTIRLPVGGQTYTFDDTAKLSVLPGRILFYRVRLVP